MNDSVLTFDRKLFTKWVVKVDDKREHSPAFGADYGTTKREGRDCEQFTLFEESTELGIVQIRIFPDGTITSTSYIPTFVRINPGENLIEITLFDPA